MFLVCSNCGHKWHGYRATCIKCHSFALVDDSDQARFERRCQILPLLDEKGRVAPTVDLSRCTVTYGSGVSALTL